MKSSKTMAEALHDALHSKHIEPNQRLVGGQFGYASHRFPIKGGISSIDVMAESVTKDNALLSKLRGRK